MLLMPLEVSASQNLKSLQIFHTIPEALEDLRSGKMLIVVDDEHCENKGDLLCAAQFVTPGIVDFMATHARGLLCLAMESSRLDALNLRPMVQGYANSYETALSISVDAAQHLGVSTGISAEDRARTIQACIHPETQPHDLHRPGHIFPLRAREGGVLVRADHTEAAIDLMQQAGLYPAGLICEIQNLDGSIARLPDLIEYSKLHHLKIISIADLIDYRLKHERLIQREAVAELPTEFGQFKIYAYRNILDKSEHIAIVKGNPEAFQYQDLMVRVHSECLTGDILGSLRCDCRSQLHSALTMIEQAGQGVIIYLRQEGRGIGLINKLKAYSLQERGFDTVEANEKLGFKPDLRNYGIGAQILNDIGVRKIRLITNNPRKIAGLQGFGLDVVDRIPLLIESNTYNTFYLSTKFKKLGHLLLSEQSAST